MYITIGIIAGIIYLMFSIINVFFNITKSDAFTFNLLWTHEKPKDYAFVIIFLSIIMAVLIMIMWPIIIFTIIVWLLSLILN